MIPVAIYGHSIDDSKRNWMDWTDSVLTDISMLCGQKGVCTLKVTVSCPSYKDNIPNVRKMTVTTQLALLNWAVEM